MGDMLVGVGLIGKILLGKILVGSCWLVICTLYTVQCKVFIQYILYTEGFYIQCNNTRCTLWILAILTKSSILLLTR